MRLVLTVKINRKPLMEPDMNIVQQWNKSKLEAEAVFLGMAKNIAKVYEEIHEECGQLVDLEDLARALVNETGVEFPITAVWQTTHGREELIPAPFIDPNRLLVTHHWPCNLEFVTSYCCKFGHMDYQVIRQLAELTLAKD
jgi:hypothetical protein